MQIPLVDLRWQHRLVQDELNAIFQRILADPYADDLTYARELEPMLAAYFGVPEGCAITVQSGTSAQFLALKALGIGPGDEVITVPNSDLPTTSSISHTGATFRLADVEAATHNLDPALIEAAITPSTRAVVPVHMFGRPADMTRIRELAHARGLLVIEDATLALGAEHRGVKAGLWGDAAFFSFAPRKVLGGFSNGGLVLTRDPDVAHRVRLLRGYGQDPSIMEKPIHERHQQNGMAGIAEGYNFKLDGIQAAVVLTKFPYLHAWGELRQAVAERYAAGLIDVPGVTLPAPIGEDRHAWRNYVILVPPAKRDAIRHYLAQNGVTTSVMYAPPIHLQPVYRHLGLGEGSFPVVEALADSLLALPIYPGMTEEQVDYVVEKLREAFLLDTKL
ncbi:MAG: DegT/DnrJ/EryC1/StrS family aminotransferase [Caldilineaceae bacterium]|nr:DegT/DnrJ/EryC1/StrS family aminotransferase [Caldilineaceae bacterium]